MPSAFSSDVTRSSGITASILELLDRVTVRRVSSEDVTDPVYRLRYEAYRREGFIPENELGITKDAFDDSSNVLVFGVEIDGKLASSIRMHFVSPNCRVSPSLGIWPDVLGGLLDQGKSYIDPSRFTASQKAREAYATFLPYLTLRPVVMACYHLGAHYCISSVRREHAAFYRRVFGSVQMAGTGNWGELTFPVNLYAADLAVRMEATLRRFPFFRSTEEERQALLGSRVGNAIRSTAREAMRTAFTDRDLQNMPLMG